MPCLLIAIPVLLLAAIAVWRGWLVDSRDPDYTMGRVLGHRPFERRDRSQS